MIVRRGMRYVLVGVVIVTSWVLLVCFAICVSGGKRRIVSCFCFILVYALDWTEMEKRKQEDDGMVLRRILTMRAKQRGNRGKISAYFKCSVSLSPTTALISSN